MRLKGKTALITAAGQGMGRAAALAYAAEGAQVWATDVNTELLKAYDGMAGITALPLNVLDRAAIEKTVSGLPALDVLFNCAGFVHSGTIAQASDAEWDFAFNLNVRSQFWMIQAVLPKMLAANGPAEPLHLRHHQSCGDRPDQKRGGRFRRPERALQCRLPRHSRHAFAAGPHQRF